MSRKEAIPTTGISLNPNTDAMDLLAKRMSAAEKDTHDLVDQLTKMGFSNTGKVLLILGVDMFIFVLELFVEVQYVV